MKVHPLAVVLILGSFALADEPVTAPTEAAPDFASMDKATLVVMCQQLWARVQGQQKLIAEYEAKSAASPSDSPADDDAPAGSADGVWTVKVTSNQEPDTSGISAQLKAAQDSLNSANERVASAQKALNNVLSKGEYDRDHRRYGYQREERANAEAALQQTRSQANVAKMDVTRLQRQLDGARKTRTIIGVTDDGRAAKLIARGAYAGIASTIKEGSNYTVSGRGIDNGGTLTIYIKAADIAASATTP